MPEFNSAGHIITEDAPLIMTIDGVATSTCVYVGVAEKGPIGKAVAVTTWSEFVEIFGSYIKEGWLAYAVYGHFLQQPQAPVYVIRTTHYLNIDDPISYNGESASVIIKDASNVDTLQVSAVNEGVWGDNLKILIEENTQNKNSFNIVVYEKKGATTFFRERIKDLVMDEESENFVEKRLAKNKWITATSLDSESADPLPVKNAYHLTGGDNGLSGITDIDYIGSQAARNGIYAADRIPGMLQIAVPGITTIAVHNALLDYCAGRTNSFSLLDLPEGLTYQESKEYVRDHGGFNSTYGATYWPRVIIKDPLTGLDKVVPNSGFVLGAYARTDKKKGVWKVAAGVEDGRLVGVVGLENTDVNEKAVRDLLDADNINPICFLQGYGIRIYGAETLDRTGAFPFVNERRTFLFCEQSIADGTQWIEFENNDEKLWKRIILSVKSFLNFVWKQDGLRGSKPSEAYIVKCDSETNPQEFIDRGIVQGMIGLSTHRPAKHVWFRFSRKTASLDE